MPETFPDLDTGDQQAAIKRLIKAMGVDEERFPARDIMHYINGLKEQGIRSGQAEAYDAHTRRKVEIYAEYEVQCQREGAVDFAELLLRASGLLQQDEALRTHYQKRFRHIVWWMSSRIPTHCSTPGYNRYAARRRVFLPWVMTISRFMPSVARMWPICVRLSAITPRAMSSASNRTIVRTAIF